MNRVPHNDDNQITSVEFSISDESTIIKILGYKENKITGIMRNQIQPERNLNWYGKFYNESESLYGSSQSLYHEQEIWHKVNF